MVLIEKSLSRQSGIELLRLFAMYMILLLHANYLSFGNPTAEDIHLNFFTSFSRVLAEQLCIVAVNVYVLISGWFGIKPKIKSIVGLMLQVFTYSAVIMIIWIIIRKPILHFSDVMGVFIIGKQYWFIVAYLLLYILSPVLNAFIDNSSKKTIKNFLVAFFSFEFIYGWFQGEGGFSRGYSALSFIGLYLLARYLRVYGGWITNRSVLFYIVCYLLLSIIVSFWVIVQYYFIDDVFFFSYFEYNCPFVILTSILLFLAFSKIAFKSGFINYCSTSALSVYLIHTNPCFFESFQSSIRDLYTFYPHIGGVLLIMIILALFMAICIIIDKIRISLTPIDSISKVIERLLGISS